MTAPRTIDPEVEAFLTPPGSSRREWLDLLFALQARVIADHARFKAVTCSRRAGKTVMLAAAAMDALEACGHDEYVVYLAQTRGIARDLLWGKVRELARQFRPQWTVHEAALRLENEKGGVLVVRGVEGSSPGEELHKLRGLKMRRVLADEPATYAETLGPLLRDVLEPALGDLRGDVIVAGTPGVVCAGTWHQISAHSSGSRKWSRHGWTLLENPHFPEAAQYLAETRLENGWEEHDPTYRREYLGHWVVDDSAQVYRYLASRNLVELPADYDPATWVHTIGVDFGMADDCAWVVWAARPTEQTVYAVHASKRAGLLVSQAAETTARLVADYRPHWLVGDAGGLGKPYVEEWNARWADRVGCCMTPADKADKRGAIDLLNSDLRTARALVTPGAQALADEWAVLPWKDSQRREEHPAYANHCADAGLYGWRAHRAWAHQAPPQREVLAPDDDRRLLDEIARFKAQQNRGVWDE